MTYTQRQLYDVCATLNLDPTEVMRILLTPHLVIVETKPWAADHRPELTMHRIEP